MIVNNKLGITLSGGGFRGIAHLGVLQYVQELKMIPDEISGTSAGALLGAFIAHGYTPEEVLDFCKKEKLFSYSDISMTRGGLFSTSILEKIIKKYIPHDSFEQLKKPLFVAVTDLTNARSLVFNRGSLSLAVKSSCCFPLVFQPVLYKDAYLCDGGLLNNFPVEQVRANCNKVIGINVDTVGKMEGEPGYKEIITRLIRIATANMVKSPEKNCDLYIRMDELSRYGTFETKKMDELFQAGYQHAKKYRKDLLAIKENLQANRAG